MTIVNNIKNLKEICVPGVYCFVNENDKKVFISHSTNILNSVSKILLEISNGIYTKKDIIKDVEKLEFKVLEKEEFRIARLVKLEKYIIEFKVAGYELYNRSNFSPKYKIDYYITKDFEVWVCLVNSRYKKFMVKQFSNVDAAKNFIQKNKIEDVVNLYITTKKSIGL